MGTKREEAGVSINPQEMLSGEELKQEMESRNKVSKALLDLVVMVFDR
jgi:hypothetical protein